MHHTTKKYQRLTDAEREEISRCLAQGTSISGIASIVEREVSTISREVSRNSGTNSYPRILGRKTRSRTSLFSQTRQEPHHRQISPPPICSRKTEKTLVASRDRQASTRRVSWGHDNAN